MRTRSLAWILLGILTMAGVAWAQTPCGTWTASPTPNPNPLFSHLLGVTAVSATDVWAVGEYDSLAGTYTPMLRAITAHWNGSAWSTIPTPSVGPSGTTLTGTAAVGANDVWAVGYSSTYGTPQTLVQHWDGSRWSVVPSPIIQGGSSLEAVTRVSGNDLWAVGNRNGGLPEFSATVVTLTVHWNGSAWLAVPSPNVGNRWNDLAAVSASSANDVWAVGSWRNTAGLYQNLAVHWNGSSWTIVPTPNAPGSENELSAVVAIASDDVWAVGHSNDGITMRSVFLHWNGSAWSNVPGPGGGTALAGTSGLVALASDDVWAVGNTVAHWNGASWSLAPNPVVSGAAGLGLIGASKVGACDVWAAGGFWDDAGASHTLAAHLTSGGGSINQPPVAVASATPSSGLAPLTVNLSSAGSHDADGTIVSYLWDFGDSSYPLSRTEANPVHTYVQTGPLTYHAVVQVTDDHGATSTSSVTIHIDNPVHVQSQQVARVPQGAGWVADDVVAIMDSQGLPIPDATVTAGYSGPTGGVVTGTTNVQGTTTLRTAGTSNPTSEWCFTITGVSGAGAGYVPASNVVTSQCESGTLDAPPGRQPTTLELSAGPNPFSHVAAIHLSLPRSETITLRVLDASGRLVRDLLRETLPAGVHQARWDGRDGNGTLEPPGLYFVQLSAGGELRSVRLLRLR